MVLEDVQLHLNGFILYHITRRAQTAGKGLPVIACSSQQEV
jgi:hypothetical protein